MFDGSSIFGHSNNFLGWNSDIPFDLRSTLIVGGAVAVGMACSIVPTALPLVRNYFHDFTYVSCLYHESLTGIVRAATTGDNLIATGFISSHIHCVGTNFERQKRKCR